MYMTKEAIKHAFDMGCRLNSNGYFVDLPKALVTARDFLPDRRYKIFCLAGHGNGHGDTGGLIECAGIKLWWSSYERPVSVHDVDENGKWIGTCHVENRACIKFEDYRR